MPKSTLLTGCHIRMARAALKWSEKELARRAGLGVATVRRVEKILGPSNTEVETQVRLRRAFQDSGVQFLPDTGTGPGVRYDYPGRDAEAADP